MATTLTPTIGERIADLAEADLATRPAEVWAVALEAERAGVATGLVDALLDPASPAVVRERALARIAAVLVQDDTTAPTPRDEVVRAMVAAGL